MYRKQLLITKTIIKPQPTDSQIEEYWTSLTKKEQLLSSDLVHDVLYF